MLGLIAVTCTESLGIQWLGITSWGRWPLTIHSAGWGMVFNATTAIVVSALTNDPDERAHRQTFHSFLRETTALPARKKRLVPLACASTLTWFMLAIGPGAVIGNTIFGDPNDAQTWLFGIPSIWAWQILWWALGVLMMWMLAYKMQMSTVPAVEIEPLRHDIGDEESGE